MQNTTILPNTQNRSVWLLIVGALLILCGVYVLFNPITALITSAMLVGIAFIFIGTSYLMSYRENTSYTLLAMGILDLFIGLLFLTNLGISAANMPIILGLWILFNSTISFVMGLELRHRGNKNGRFLFWSGLIGILFALLVFALPIIGTVTLTLVVGLYLIIYGLFEINRYIKAY